MAFNAPVLVPGTKVDTDFVVRETLGKGKGGGAVYRAKRQSHPVAPPVALKFPAGSTELEALREVQEALGVPRLLATGNYMGQRYAVTPIMGMPLSELFRRIEPMSVEDKWGCVKIFGRLLLRRLEAVHRRGWVHGDVAPDNVLFGRGDDGRVSLFLIDFGCARRFPGGEAVKAFWNTVEFASVRAVEDTVREPYDDLESLGYVLCHGIFGDLPWFRWTRGRNNWEETRGRDCERVRQVKLTLLRGEWCSLGFEWIQLMKMPLDLTKLLARCLYRPKAEDGLPDYSTLAQLLGEHCEDPEVSEAIDIAFISEKCQEFAPEWHPPVPEPQPRVPAPGGPPAAPVGDAVAAAGPSGRAGAPAPPRASPAGPEPPTRGGDASPQEEIAPERTRSSLFDFDELDGDPVMAEAEPEPAAAAEPAPAGPEAPARLSAAAPVAREPRAAGPEEERHCCAAARSREGAAGSPRSPRTPRTRGRWFDFEKLDDVEMVEA